MNARLEHKDGSNYPSLLLHSNVRWEKVLSHFAACLSEIRTSLKMKGVEHPELTDIEWLLQFHYLMDITGHLNQLSMKMQGIGNTVVSLQSCPFPWKQAGTINQGHWNRHCLPHFGRHWEFRDACLASDPTHRCDLQQLAVFTSRPFKSHFVCTVIFKFITHPNWCAVDKTNLMCIPEVSIGDGSCWLEGIQYVGK